MKGQLQNIDPCYIQTVVSLGLMKWYFHDFYIQTALGTQTCQWREAEIVVTTGKTNFFL